MAPQDSFIDEDDDCWYVSPLPRELGIELDLTLRHLPNHHFPVPFVWKSSICQTRIFDHVLVGIR